MSALPRTPAILHLTRFADVCRVNLFDIVTQYKAIFPSTGLPSVSSRSSAAIASSVTRQRLRQLPEPAPDAGNPTRDDADDELDFNDSRILSSWLLHKIDSCLQVISEDLAACQPLIDESPNFPLDSIVDPCFYFGLSMSRIGADIRPQILVMFYDVFRERNKRVLERASLKFQESLVRCGPPADAFSCFALQASCRLSSSAAAAAAATAPASLQAPEEDSNVVSSQSGGQPLSPPATTTTAAASEPVS